MAEREGPPGPEATRMRVARATSGGGLEVTERGLPAPGPGEVLVRVRACGICGSDLHAHRKGSWPEGLVPGHEIAGEVAARGVDADRDARGHRLADGSRVVVEPLVSCGRCAWCRSGRDSICPSLSILGVHRAGGFADYVVAPAHRLHTVDPDLPPEIACLAEPLAVGLHGLDRGDVGSADRLLVLGAGPIGLLTLLGARACGVREIAISAKYPAQAEQARRLGADRIVDATRPMDARDLRSGFEVVVETVGGRSRSLVEAAYHLAPGGRIVVLGLFEPDPPMDPEPLLEKEASLLWSNCYQRRREPTDFRRAVDMVEERAALLRPLVRAHGPLDRIGEGLEQAASRDRSFSKLVIRP